MIMSPLELADMAGPPQSIEEAEGFGESYRSARITRSITGKASNVL